MEHATEQQTPAPEPSDDPEVARYTDAMRRFSGDLRMTKQVFASMEQRGVSIGAVHWQLLLAAHLDTRDLPGAHQVLERMRAAGVEVPASTRWDLALATARSGRTDQAIALLDALHADGLDPDERHAPGVLAIYLATGRMPAARAVLRQMAQRGQAAGDAEYDRLLRDCLDRRAIKDTRTIVDLMLQVGRAPSPRMATQLVAMIARAGHTDRARELLDRLSSAGVSLPGDVHTELFLAHAKAGDIEAAQGALDAMRAGGTEPTSFHRNTVLSARLAAGDVDGAWADALSLTADGRIPSGENLEGLLDVSLAAGRVAAASGVLDWMIILGVPVPPQKAAEVLSKHLQAGELDLTLTLFDELARRGVPADRRVARDVVERLVRARRLDEARARLERFRVSGTLTHGRHYGSLLAAYLQAKRLDVAVALLRHMVAKKLEPTVSDASKLVNALVKGGQLAEAGSLIGDLQDAGVQVDEPTFRELLWAHARKGEAEAARVVHARMVAAGITPDDRHQKALEWASGETKRRLPEDAADGDEPSVTELPESGEPSGTEVPTGGEPSDADAPGGDAEAEGLVAVAQEAAAAAVADVLAEEAPIDAQAGSSPEADPEGTADARPQGTADAPAEPPATEPAGATSMPSLTPPPAPSEGVVPPSMPTATQPTAEDGGPDDVEPADVDTDSEATPRREP